MAGNVKKTGKVYCSVDGCHTTCSTGRLYMFPVKNLEQRQLWIEAVKRKRLDGSTWEPKRKGQYLCNYHFHNQTKSPTRTDKNYVPTIFPVNFQCKTDCNYCLSRIKKHMKKEEKAKEMDDKEEDNNPELDQGVKEENAEDEEAFIHEEVFIKSEELHCEETLEEVEEETDPIAVINGNVLKLEQEYDDVEEMFDDKPPKMNRVTHIYCVVPGCHTTNKMNIQMFTFPSKNMEQRQLWVKALDRRNPDGSLYEPSPSTRICALHFVSGKKSLTRYDVNYAPTIFPRNKVCADRCGLCINRITRKPIEYYIKKAQEEVDPLKLDQPSERRKWYHGCEYRCCHESCRRLFFSTVHLKKHIETCHQEGVDEYLGKFEKFETKTVHYECELCGNNVKLNFTSVKKHLALSHHGKMSLDEYKCKFGRVRKKVKFDIQQWADRCQYACKLCKQVVVKKKGYVDITAHLKDTHFSSSLNLNEHALANFMLVTVQQMHKCHICHLHVIHDKYHLQNHTVQAHKLTLDAYFYQHVDPNVYL